MGKLGGFGQTVQNTLFSALMLGLPPELLQFTWSDFSENLARESLQVSQWVENLNAQDYSFLCLGERHSDNFREYIAEKIFSDLRFDVLFIETTPDKAFQIVELYHQGEKNIPLLGANLFPVLRAAFLKNPHLKVVGVERTQEQRRLHTVDMFENEGQTRLSREGFIAKNILDNWHSGKKHVALYGALHCALNDIGLPNEASFFRLLRSSRPQPEKWISSRLVNKEMNIYFNIIVNSFTLSGSEFVLPLGHSIKPQTYNYNWKMMELLENFDTIIRFE